jgi:aminotransferase in exopolysaccharide biosynthesis
MLQLANILSFIRQTFKQPEGFIPLHAPVFSGNEKKYLGECIDSTYVSSVGSFVDIFEIEIAKITGASKAVVCVNGTSALHMALLLCGVKPGEEVITQPLTFIATANAIKYCQARPIFIDIDKATLGLSPDVLTDFLRNNTEQKSDGCYNKKTKKRISACIPMHTFGHPCRIDEIVEVCKVNKISVIEDAAESMGSYFKNRHTGTFGEIGVLSFNGNKIITTGGGGILLFKDEKMAKRAKHLTTQAKIPHAWNFEHDEVGYNYRMPNINAALGLAQLEQLDRFIEAKRRLAFSYEVFFAKLNIPFFKEPPYARSNYWLNAIFLDNRDERDEFLEYTNHEGVMTRPAWELMTRLPMFRDSQCSELCNSEWIADRLVNIPSSVIF